MARDVRTIRTAGGLPRTESRERREGFAVSIEGGFTAQSPPSA
jgi:hypothetical protein